MKQRILTFTKRFTAIDRYSFDLDKATEKLNAEGWAVKQIISTSFTHVDNAGSPFPVMAVTLLVEQE